MTTCCCGCGDKPPAHCLRGEIELLRTVVGLKDAEIKQLRERIEGLVIRELQQRYKAEAAWGKICDLRAAVREIMADD